MIRQLTIGCDYPGCGETLGTDGPLSTSLWHDANWEREYREHPYSGRHFCPGHRFCDFEEIDALANEADACGTL